MNTHISQKDGDREMHAQRLHPPTAPNLSKEEVDCNHLPKDPVVPTFCDSETPPPPYLPKTTLSINKLAELCNLAGFLMAKSTRKF